jgi:arylamine N-acetyltransferase
VYGVAIFINGMRLSSWSPKYYTLKRTKRNNSYGPRNFCRKTSPLKTRESTKKWCSHHEISQYKQTVKNVTVLKRGRVLMSCNFQTPDKNNGEKIKM